MQVSKPLNVAHRGASGTCPENTMASFLQAVEDGCTGIELDVQVSKDGEFVVFHDYSLSRTTDGVGRLSDYTVTELKKLDAGSWFDEKFKDERIPLLEEVLEKIPSHIMLNIELKYNPYSFDGMEMKLLNLLNKASNLENIVISSFNHKSLYNIKKVNEDVNIGLLYDANLVDHYRLIDSFGLPCYSLHPHCKMIHSEDIRQSLAKGTKVFLWTVNGEEEYDHFIKLGVTGIITDYPARLKRRLQKLYT